ncbi:hypothetical protein J3R30DRAFT_3404061 [Lentinula aciculospora]|uniref:Uncharacterized protein n=1 Tax=Lentinula aciculospora TaxID=153920 RepID=A0A9W9ACZ1_9AGAR|nr:hypothetical protein J3R30DRAFT_3404061 [Lentinula aciculospora]
MVPGRSLHLIFTVYILLASCLNVIALPLVAHSHLPRGATRSSPIPTDSIPLQQLRKPTPPPPRFKADSNNTQPPQPPPRTYTSKSLPPIPPSRGFTSTAAQIPKKDKFPQVTLNPPNRVTKKVSFASDTKPVCPDGIPLEFFCAMCDTQNYPHYPWAIDRWGIILNHARVAMTLPSGTIATQSISDKSGKNEDFCIRIKHEATISKILARVRRMDQLPARALSQFVTDVLHILKTEFSDSLVLPEDLDSNVQKWIKKKLQDVDDKILEDHKGKVEKDAARCDNPKNACAVAWSHYNLAISFYQKQIEQCKEQERRCGALESQLKETQAQLEQAKQQLKGKPRDSCCVVM